MNKVHYNLTVFSDDIEQLHQTAVHPQETETIWFETAIGKLWRVPESYWYSGSHMIQCLVPNTNLLH